MNDSIKFSFFGMISLVFALAFGFPAKISAQGGVDPNTLLLLRFENTLNGEQGQSPVQSSGVTFEPGILGQGVLVDSSDILRFATAGNLSAAAGTIELWVKPRWNGTETINRCLFAAGNSHFANGTMVFQKDGGGSLAATVNVPHASVDTNVSSWTANQWHYVAYTWAFPGEVKIYVDGVQRFSRPAVSQDIISPVPTMLSVGSSNTAWQANAVIDELRVSNRPRTAQEISSRFLAALTVNSISLSAVTTNLWKTWRITPTVTANTNVGTLPVSAWEADWSSSNPSVAIVNENGQIIGVEAGTAVLTANLNGAQATLTVNVRAPVLPPRFNQLDSLMTTPAAGSLYDIPVIVLRYLPTTDGVKLDPAYTGQSPSTEILIAPLEQRLNEYDRNWKFMLEEGSRFRGYGSQTVAPSLSYRIVASITVYEPTPPGKVTFTARGLPSYGAEWFQIFERFNLQNYINNLGVRQIWFWKNVNDADQPGYNPNVHLPEYLRDDWESNLSSPTTPDVSNSNRDSSDLPILDRSYVIYGNHNLRAHAEGAHIFGHQMESFMAYANQLQTGNTQLFWQKFVGRDANFNWLRGRAGDVHHPPNVLTDYDWNNYTSFPSDIMDWKPDGGQTTNFSAATYGNIAYNFAVPNPQSAVESKWYMFWFQSMPGRGNTIPFGTNRMTNWWQFVADWDGANRAGMGLYEPASCNFSLSSNGRNFQAAGGAANVNVTTGSGCRWFASSNAPWIQITSGDNGNNGNTTVNFTVLPNITGGSRSTTVVIGGQVFNVTQTGNRTRFDYDGDGKTDIGIFRPGPGEWWYIRSSDGQVPAGQFGAGTDNIAPVDFTGDGKADIAFWRPSTGEWFVLRSEDNSYLAFPFGTTGDVPVPADYDNDGKADAAVFRPSNSTWYISQSGGGGVRFETFGVAGDVPVAADYDGDGKADVAIYRPSLGEWWINRSTSGLRALRFGISTDKPVQGDYTGDGKADLAFWRPTTGEWFIVRSENDSFYSFPFGANGDLPSPGDYDGDGRTDPAVFRPAGSTWFIQRTTAGTQIVPFGTTGDRPIANAFVP